MRKSLLFFSSSLWFPSSSALAVSYAPQSRCRWGRLLSTTLLSECGTAGIAPLCIEKRWATNNNNNNNDSQGQRCGVRLDDIPEVDDLDPTRVREYSIHAKRILEHSTGNSSSRSSSIAGDTVKDKVGAEGGSERWVPSPPTAEERRRQVYPAEFRKSTAVSGEKDEQLLRMWRERPNDAPAAGPSSDAATQRRPLPSPACPPTPQNFASSGVASSETFQDQRPRDPNEPLEHLRRRLRYQSQYRGMVEMDLIFGHFARKKIELLDRALLQEYDLLLKQLDNELFKWLVMGDEAPKEIGDLRCFQLIQKFVREEREELLGHY